MCTSKQPYLEEGLEDIGVAECHKDEGQEGGEATVEDGRPHLGHHLDSPGLAPACTPPTVQYTYQVVPNGNGTGFLLTMHGVVKDPRRCFSY